jgi:sugar transferase (PEP-CTERM system associated)
VTVPSSAIVGTIDDIVELSKRHNAHTIVIALTERRGNLVIEKLVTCKLMGVRIMDYPSFFEVTTGKIPVEEINPSWLVQSSGFFITPFIRLMKRIVDVLFASTLLVVTLPLLPVIACGIKLTSKGPVFYLQKRVGVNGRPFTIFKFRSMADNAEQGTGASWARENDPRVTPIGAFIRKTRIDELPQLVNVLKGDMSFIGPRPERPEFVEKISRVTPYYLERHAVKPGITGWAQVMYPYGSSLGDSVEKLRYDLYYINNLSFVLEILIVLETIKVVLFRRGGR